MKPCPYRRDHEWDAEGLCANCYAALPPPLPVPVENIEVFGPPLEPLEQTQPNTVVTTFTMWGFPIPGDPVDGP